MVGEDSFNGVTHGYFTFILIMSQILKIVFCTPLVVNALFGVFILIVSIWELIAPSSPFRTVNEQLVVLVASLTTLALLGGAYHLTVVRERGWLGFALLILSYINWLFFWFFTPTTGYH